MTKGTDSVPKHNLWILSPLLKGDRDLCPLLQRTPGAAAGLHAGRRPLAEWLAAFEQTLPPLDGNPISLQFRPRLSAFRGRLLSGRLSLGKPVWAGSFIRRRLMVLDSELLRHEAALRGILIHELFHFVWVRAGNPARRGFAALLTLEAAAGARGEVGESSEVQKCLWRSAGGAHGSFSPSVAAGAHAWAAYVCESFCDTAAWALCPRAPGPVSLSPRWQKKRRQWFREWIALQATGVRV